MKKLGIIGGLGPMATIYFMELIVKMTKADTDRDHIPMIVYNYPDTPDRTAYLLDNSKENPYPYISDMAKLLKEQGCDYFAMPCITAHFFSEDLKALLGDGFISMIDEVARYLCSKNIKTVGLMATDGTVQSKVFEQTLNKYDIKVVTPDYNDQRLVMKTIYDEVKAGKPVNVENMYIVKNHLKKQGAELVLLGCTELSVVKGQYPLDPEFFDVLEILASRCVEQCGGDLTYEYSYLKSKEKGN